MDPGLCFARAWSNESPSSQVLTWGLRNMKTYQLATVSSPSLIVECGGEIVQTAVVKNFKKNPNFPGSVLLLKVVSVLFCFFCVLVHEISTPLVLDIPRAASRLLQASPQRGDVHAAHRAEGRRPQTVWEKASGGPVHHRLPRGVSLRSASYQQRRVHVCERYVPMNVKMKGLLGPIRQLWPVSSLISSGHDGCCSCWRCHRRRGEACCEKRGTC